MEQLSRIEAALESLSELGDLVGALRSMAASRAREAQEAFAATRAYRGTVEAAIAAVAPLVPARPVEEAPPATAGALIVLTSENGFVGGFNARLVERAAETRQEDERLVLVGRRGQIAATERDLVPDRVLGMTSRAGGVTALARRIAAEMQGVGAVRLVHAEHRPGTAFEIRQVQVLPMKTPGTAAGAADPPIIQIAPETLLERLSGEYLFAEIAAALMESLASENSERLKTMDAASRNVEDRLTALRRKERLARQEETTTGMLDVVTGAEAVNHR